MDIESIKEIKGCLLKIADFAYAIWLDGKSPSDGSIALTMADEIRRYCGKALEGLHEELSVSRTS